MTRKRTKLFCAVALCVAALCWKTVGPTFAADGVYPEKFVGKVVDANGKPAANATVRLLFSAKIPANPPTTRTDADGRFELPNLPQEKAQELAQGATNAPKTRLLATTADGSECGEAPVRVDGGETEIRTFPGRVFSGTVVDETGSPISGASVWIGTQDAPIYVGTTDEDGNYRIPTSKTLKDWTLFAFKKGVDFVVYSGTIREMSFDWKPDWSKPEDATNAPKRITLRKRAATVAFVDESGAPVVGLKVLAQGGAKVRRFPGEEFTFKPKFSAANFEEFERTTNEKGEITLEVLPSRSTPNAEITRNFLKVVLLNPDLREYNRTAERKFEDAEFEIKIDWEKSSAPIRFVLQERAAVFGRVVNPDGTPAANADVAYSLENYPNESMRTHTNKNGEYECPESPDQRVVAIAASGRKGAAATVRPPNDPNRPRRLRVDIQLVEGVKVFGTGEPYHGFTLFEEPLDESGDFERGKLARPAFDVALDDDETDRYEIWLPKTPRTYRVGSFYLSNRKELRVDGSETEIEFNLGRSPTESERRSDESETEIKFGLDEPPTESASKADGVYPEKFVGKVVDASGRPAANATVRLLFSAKIPANPPTTRTDADGRFELPNLP